MKKKKTPPGFVKLNWNARCNKKQRTIGSRAIMRVHEGQVLGSLSVKKSIETSPFTTKTMALMEAVNFCKSAGFSKLILEGDTLQVVKILQSKLAYWSEGGCLITDSRLLLDSFTHWSVQHIPRECNTTTHQLAKFIPSISSYQYLLEDFPVCITNNVMLDAI